VPFPAVTMMSVAESVKENCTVEWLEWHRSSGRTFVEHHRQEGCRVEVRDGYASVTFADGGGLWKKVDARGFRWYEPGRKRPANKVN